MKKNQTISTGRGGRRPGAGRKKGARNQKTAALLTDIAATGLTPLDYLLRVMRDETGDEARRVDAAKAAAPYVHAKLAPIEPEGKNNPADKVADALGRLIDRLPS